MAIGAPLGYVCDSCHMVLVYDKICFWTFFSYGTVMDATIPILILLLIFLIGLARIDPPACPPPPPPVVIDNLGPEATTPMGVPTDLIRTIYSVVEPPQCVQGLERPQAKHVPDTGDVRHILQQMTRRMRPRQIEPGHVVSSIVYIDAENMGTYYITTMLHDVDSGITIRVAVKARLRVGSFEAPRILNVRFDPQHSDPGPHEPCRAGRVPTAGPRELDPSIYDVPQI